MPERLRSIFAVPGAAAIPVKLLLALQFVILVLSVVGIGVIDRGETAPLAWALIVLVAVSPFLRHVPAADALAVLFSAALYGGIQVARTIQGGSYIPEAFAGALCFMVVAWLGRTVALRLSFMEEEASRNAVLVEELTVHDTVTGAIKPRYAHQVLVAEVQRSRRYNHPLSLLIIGIVGWEDILKERGFQATDLMVQEREILTSILRDVDKVSRHTGSQFAVILPETPLQAARCVAEKICRRMADEPKVTVRIGIAEFPTDAVAGEELIAEAEAALEFAETASLRIADRSLIS